MRRTFTPVLLSLTLLSLSACAPKVLTQPLPVSTDPVGVNLSVDGKSSCITPCQLDLPRNQDHILTLTKDGYKQQDVVIKRQYQTQKVLLNAINQGSQSANFFKNNAWGFNGGVQSINEQEDTGEAYVLVPSTLRVRMMPVGGWPVAANSAPGATAHVPVTQLLERMSPNDEQMLENALERSRSGQPNVWTNAETGMSFSAVPEPATKQMTGEIVRPFTLAARLNGETRTASGSAVRAGRGEWTVEQNGRNLGDVPNVQGQNAPGLNMWDGTGQPGGQAVDKGAQEMTQRETTRALEQTTWPSASKSWDVGSSGSSKSNTTHGADGSSTTTTTSTKTSAKVSMNANPASITSALGALEGLLQ